MDLINPNISWNNIKSYITSISGIIFMTPGSRKLIEYLYSGNLKDAAKKINSYIWRGTRDTTMVLITGGLIVLAEKIEKDSNADPHLEQKAKDLTEKNTQRLQTLFERMAEGDGTQLGLLLNGYKEFENFFKAVLIKSGNNIKKEKAENEYKKYVAQMKRIKPWKYSANAIQNNVKPVFEKTFKDTTLKNKFINNITIEGEAKYDNIFYRVMGQKLEICNGFTISLQDRVNEQSDPCSEPVNIDRTILYVSTDSDEDIPNIYFAKRSLIELMRKEDIRNKDGFESFLKTYFKEHKEKIEQAMTKISLKSNLIKLCDNRYEVEGISVHNFNIELVDYITLTSDPFEVKSEPYLLDIDVNEDQVLGYLYKKKIVNLADIKTELDRILKPIAEKLKFIQGIESYYNYMHKDKIDFSLSISEPKDDETKTTPNGLEIHYEIANGKINIEVNRKALLEFFAKVEVKDKDAGETEITEAIEEILQENPLKDAPSKPAPKSPAKEPAQEAVGKSTEKIVEETLKKFNGDNKYKELYKGKKYKAAFGQLNLYDESQKEKLEKLLDNPINNITKINDAQKENLTIIIYYQKGSTENTYTVYLQVPKQRFIERLKNKKISNNPQEIEALLGKLLTSTRTPIQQHFASKE